MHSFLGSALFFASFTPHFATLSAPLYKMTHKDFIWNPDKWTRDYHADYTAMKKAITDCVANFYPNEKYRYQLRGDASDYACAAVLLALPIDSPVDDSNAADFDPKPIAFASQQFSEQALNWSPFEKECYALFFACLIFQYYLWGQHFVLLTDHKNLLWLEQSKVPKVIRWRLFMQSFSFTLAHIPGQRNMVADWLSRIPSLKEAPLAEISASEASYSATMELEASLAEISAAEDPIDALLSKVHGGRSAHHGARRTWLLLNKLFPGHGISFQTVLDFINRCATCQKTRLLMQTSIPPLIRTLLPAHQQRVIGIDTLKISPTDQYDHSGLIVIVCIMTKFTKLYPVRNYDALTLATCIFQYCCSYGLVDVIRSDQGSDLSADIIAHLTAWWGITHIFALVDCHESNGVERTNQEIIRHLRAIVFDERIKHKWSDPTVLPWVEYQLNSTDSSETGVIPFDAKFGSAASTYFVFPSLVPDASKTSTFLELLNSNLSEIQTASAAHQKAVSAKRMADNPPNPNTYQPGDLVLYQFHAPKDKLSTRSLVPIASYHTRIIQSNVAI